MTAQSHHVELSDIESAVEFVSIAYGDGEAYLDTQTGAIYYVGGDTEESIPDDLFENNRYLSIPDKYNLGLGKKLTIRFVAEFLPDHLDETYDIFSCKGAYARFKALLNSLEKLDSWHSYEEQSLHQAIKIWCAVNDVEVDGGV